MWRAPHVGVCSAMSGSSVSCVPANMTACHMPSSPTGEGEETALRLGHVAILYCMLESYCFGACVSHVHFSVTTLPDGNSPKEEKFFLAHAFRGVTPSQRGGQFMEADMTCMTGCLHHSRPGRGGETLQRLAPATDFC